MAVTPLNIIYSWFETGDYPTEAQFQATWSSFWHKSESIPMSQIGGLNEALNSYVTTSTFNTHLNDPNAHPNKAEKDASNITPQNRAIWRQVLGISDLQIEGPFNNTAEALTAVPVARRKIGKTVVVLIPGNESQIGVAQEYWWRFGTADEDLVVKNVGDGSGGGASFPATGNDGDVLEKDSAVADGVKWVEKNTTSAVNNFLHYWNSATKKWISSGVEFFSAGILKLTAIVLTSKTGTSQPTELGTDGSNVWFGATKRKLRFQDSSVFVYTPTGNFAISQVKTAMESAGYVFQDCHIIVVLGSNNYTCSIDVGASNPNHVFTMSRRGTGSISFSSTRTMDSGADSITILSGKESSMGLIQLATNTDFLTIKNK